MASYQPNTQPASASSPQFFQSPIRTLLKSLDECSTGEVAIHDLVQAYATFSERIKVLSAVLDEGETCDIALSPLRQHAAQIAQCLQRDISRALQNPITQSPEPGSAHIPASLASSTPEFSEEELKLGVDLSNIGQHALLFCSCIFRYATLNNIFDVNALFEIISSIIAIVEGPIPTPNAERTYSLALWILSSQTLPLSVIHLAKRDIVRLLTNIVMENFARSVSVLNLTDGLKVLRRLLVNYAEVSITTTVKFVRHICSHLLSCHDNVRIAAAYSLGGYSIATLTHCDSEYDASWNVAGDGTRVFISQNACKHRPAGSPSRRLYDIASAVMAAENSLDLCWLMSTLGALMILTQGSVVNVTSFPSFMRLFKNVASAAVASSRHAVRVLHVDLWRCLLWSLVLFRRFAERHGSSPERRIADWKTSWFNGIGFARQEVKDGLGSALIYCIRSLPPVRDASQGANTQTGNVLYTDPWFVVLEDMIRHPHIAIHREGISLLSHLLTSVGSPNNTPDGEQAPDVWKVLRREFLDGTSLVAESLYTLKLPTFDVSLIKPLTEMEAQTRWNELMDLWEVGLERTLKARKMPSLSDDLVSIWHALLLTNSELSQTHGHLTLPEAGTDRAMAVMLRLFVQDPSEPEQTPDDARIRLSVAKKLWTLMKNAFSGDWLNAAAGHILTSIFRAKYHSQAHDSARELWNDVCGDLISAGPQNITNILSTHSGVFVTLEVREIWNALAKIWNKISNRTDWQSNVNFLAIAPRYWKLSGDEIGLWAAIIPHSLASARSRSTPVHTVMDAIVKHVFIDSNAPSFSLLPAVVSHVTLYPEDPFPLSLFAYLNEIMSTIYPQPDALYPMLEVFQILTTLVQTYSTSHLLQLLSVMSDGLSVWISDKSTIILDDEFNDYIVSFYILCLTHLHRVPHTAETLIRLEPFLCSAFNHMPQPALAPVACRKYWDTISAAYSLGRDDCPDMLQAYLSALQDVCGGSGPLFGSQPEEEDMDDPSDRMETVPDSQPSSPLTSGFPSDLPDYYGESSVFRTAAPTLKPFQTDNVRSNNHSCHSSTGRIPVERSSSPIPFGLDNPNRFEHEARTPVIPHSSSSVSIPKSPLADRMLLQKRTRDDEEHFNVDRRPSRSSSPSSGYELQQAIDDQRVIKRARTSSPVFGREDGPGISFSEANIHRSKELFTSPGTSLLRDHLKHYDTDSENDYATWENILSSPEMRRVKEELGISGVDTDADDEDHPEDVTPMQLRGSRVGRPENSRSQSAPALKVSLPVQASLRRAQTTPGLTRAASSKMDILREAFRAVQADQSEMPLTELLDAQELLYEMNTVLNQKIRDRVE